MLRLKGWVGVEDFQQARFLVAYPGLPDQVNNSLFVATSVFRGSTEGRMIPPLLRIIDPGIRSAGKGIVAAFPIRPRNTTVQTPCLQPCSLDLVKALENMYFVNVLAGNQTLAIRALGQGWQTTVVGEALNQGTVYLALLSLSELTDQVAGLLLTLYSS